MKIPIIQIGNAKGIRLAKAILERYNFTDKAELIFEEGYLILKPVHSPRAGWEAAFEEMHEQGADELLIDDVFEEEQV